MKWCHPKWRRLSASVVFSVTQKRSNLILVARNERTLESAAGKLKGKSSPRKASRFTRKRNLRPGERTRLACWFRRLAKRTWLIASRTRLGSLGESVTFISWPKYQSDGRGEPADSTIRAVCGRRSKTSSDVGCDGGPGL